MEIKALSVDVNKLENTSGDMTELVKEAQKQVNLLSEKMTQLDAMWDGPASEEYKADMNRNINLLTECVTAAKELSTTMKKAKNKYKKVENQVVDLVGDITI